MKVPAKCSGSLYPAACSAKGGCREPYPTEIFLPTQAGNISLRWVKHIFILPLIGASMVFLLKGKPQYP
jgi:hypothetical protein